MSPQQLSERDTKRRRYLDRVFRGVENRSNSSRSMSGGQEGLMTELTDIDTEAEETNLSDDDLALEGDRSNNSSSNKKWADKVILICQPNAALYELSCYDSEKINFYLKKGLTIVFWNYRGYGRSFGSPTLSNMASDAQSILKMIKKRLKPSKLVVYGRSLGGHTAKSMCETNLVDAIVLDRTFSSIGYVPREMMGTWA
jgi:fermentation-respiration switch protein FrsA (DUF1100 family)